MFSEILEFFSNGGFQTGGQKIIEIDIMGTIIITGIVFFLIQSYPHTLEKRSRQSGRLKVKNTEMILMLLESKNDQLFHLF